MQYRSSVTICVMPRTWPSIRFKRLTVLLRSFGISLFTHLLYPTGVSYIGQKDMDATANDKS